MALSLSNTMKQFRIPNLTMSAAAAFPAILSLRNNSLGDMDRSPKNCSTSKSGYNQCSSLKNICFSF